MKCISCDSEISSMFKHALAKNECPVCGDEILDEESLVLINHIKKTLSNEAALREETLHRLALTLVTTYKISTDGLSDVNQEEVGSTPKKETKKRKRKAKKEVQEEQEEIKVAPKSAFQKISEQQEPIEEEDVKDLDNISAAERDKIMEEVVRERYNLVDSSFIDDSTYDKSTPSSSLFSEGAEQPVLERERQMRLAKQQSVLEGGGGGMVRRSS